MQYLTHEEYATMGGSLDRAAFDHMEMQARREVDYRTSGRITEDAGRCKTIEKLSYRDNLKGLMYKLITLAQRADSANQAQVSSESNSGVSRTFVTITQQEYKDKQKQLIKSYLTGETDKKGVLLLYMGV